MDAEFFNALEMLEKEKGISAELLLSKICNAITIAAKRDYGSGDNIIVEADAEKKSLNVYLRKTVVEEVTNPETELSLEEGKSIKARARIGSVIDIPLKTKEFGRIAAQNAKQVIRQSIREAERDQVLQELQGKQGEILPATVVRVDPRRGMVFVEVGNTEASLLKSEQIPDEELYEGDIIKVYVSDISVSDRGPRVSISRVHPNLVKRLFEMEVPEIFDGVVEIMSIAREAGIRTKIAVFSSDSNVDPRGACIGPRGARVSQIVDELDGEKIDIVLYNEDPKLFIAEALSPAKVVNVDITNLEAKTCVVTVPDDQLSLAIGNRGQNARLAARLTGYKIDIKPESGFFGE
ncbi:MAG: transcription termination factor NusA [Oscillospiraceae bacterium]|nr:transcription termination factor NusA [Oscillospiraceae bacterium]